MTHSNTPNNSYYENINLDKFHKMVAECAYRKAEKRGFIAVYETEDWLEAGQEISNQFIPGEKND